MTDNIRHIEELCNFVIEYADAREYEHAHVALDDIEAKIHAIRRHIEKLQSVADCAARPAGD